MKPGQVMICFDDGLAVHFNAACYLNAKGLFGVFGVISSLIDSPGMLSQDDLECMAEEGGHAICSHGKEHLWLGLGESKPGVKPHSPKEITQDIIEGAKEITALGYRGDCVLVPYGTNNLANENHAADVLCLPEVNWLRLTIGSPLPESYGGWTQAGSKRLFPADYKGRLIGISAAADIRLPSVTQEAVETAAELGTLAVLLYHDVGHPTGNAQNITWAHFCRDIDMIAALVSRGKLVCKGLPDPAELQLKPKPKPRQEKQLVEVKPS